MYFLAHLLISISYIRHPSLSLRVIEMPNVVEIPGNSVDVVVVLPQAPEDGHRSARAARGSGQVSHSLCMGVVSHSLCMGIVSHGCGGLVQDGGGGWWACGANPGVGRMSGDAGTFLECEVNILIAPDRTTIQVQSSRLGRVGIGRSFWKSLNTGRHEKAPVRCPCIRLAALHSAPRTRR